MADQRLEWLREYGMDPDGLGSVEAAQGEEYDPCFYCNASGRSWVDPEKPCPVCRGAGISSEDGLEQVADTHSWHGPLDEGEYPNCAICNPPPHLVEWQEQRFQGLASAAPVEPCPECDATGVCTHLWHNPRSGPGPGHRCDRCLGSGLADKNDLDRVDDYQCPDCWGTACPKCNDAGMQTIPVRQHIENRKQDKREIAAMAAKVGDGSEPAWHDLEDGSRVEYPRRNTHTDGRYTTECARIEHPDGSAQDVVGTPFGWDYERPEATTPPLEKFFRQACEVRADLRAKYRTSAKGPYLKCPECKGKGCNTCQDSGLIPNVKPYRESNGLICTKHAQPLWDADSHPWRCDFAENRGSTGDCVFVRVGRTAAKTYVECSLCKGSGYARRELHCPDCGSDELYFHSEDEEDHPTSASSLDCDGCGEVRRYADCEGYVPATKNDGGRCPHCNGTGLDKESAKTRLIMPARCPSCDSSETRGRYHRGGWREYTCLDCGTEFKNRDSRIAMPLYPSQLQKHIEQNGPYAYHTTSPDNIDNILRDGLKPGVEPQWDEHLQPRPGHVYMWTKDLQDCYMCGGKGKLGTAPHEVEHSCDVCEGSGKSPRTLRIDMRKLDPAKFASDEDEVVSREDADKIKQQWSDTSESLGDHVDKNKAIYDHPDMVERSLQGGSFAYHGHIPPDAIDVNPKWIQQAAWLDENNSEFKNRDSRIAKVKEHEPKKVEPRSIDPMGERVHTDWNVCPSCKGIGTDLHGNCNKCGGSGIVYKNKTVTTVHEHGESPYSPECADCRSLSKDHDEGHEGVPAVAESHPQVSKSPRSSALLVAGLGALALGVGALYGCAKCLSTSNGKPIQAPPHPRRHSGRWDKELCRVCQGDGMQPYPPEKKKSCRFCKGSGIATPAQMDYNKWRYYDAYPKQPEINHAWRDARVGMVIMEDITPEPGHCPECKGTGRSDKWGNGMCYPCSGSGLVNICDNCKQEVSHDDAETPTWHHVNWKRCKPMIPNPRYASVELCEVCDGEGCRYCKKSGLVDEDTMSDEKWMAYQSDVNAQREGHVGDDHYEPCEACTPGRGCNWCHGSGILIDKSTMSHFELKDYDLAVWCRKDAERRWGKDWLDKKKSHVGDDKSSHHSNPEQLRADHPYWDPCGACGGDGISVGSTNVETGEQKQTPCKDCGGIGEAYDYEYWDTEDQLHDFANYPNFREMKIPDNVLKKHLKDTHQQDKSDDSYTHHQSIHGINIDQKLVDALMPKAAAFEECEFCDGRGCKLCKNSGMYESGRCGKPVDVFKTLHCQLPNDHEGECDPRTDDERIPLYGSKVAGWLDYTEKCPSCKGEGCEACGGAGYTAKCEGCGKPGGYLDGSWVHLDDRSPLCLRQDKVASS